MLYVAYYNNDLQFDLETLDEFANICKDENSDITQIIVSQTNEYNEPFYDLYVVDADGIYDCLNDMFI